MQKKSDNLQTHVNREFPYAHVIVYEILSDIITLPIYVRTRKIAPTTRSLYLNTILFYYLLVNLLNINNCFFTMEQTRSIKQEYLV